MRVSRGVAVSILVLLTPPLSAEARPPAAPDLGARIDAIASLLTAEHPPHQAELPWLAQDLQDLLANGPAAGAAGPLPRDLLTHLLAQLEPLLRPDAASNPRWSTWREQALATVSLIDEKLSRQRQPRPITAAAVPLNDDCTDAEVIGDGSVQGDTTEATPDGGASCGSSEGAPDVWYSYTAPADGVVVFSTFFSSLDTVLSLHSPCPTDQDLHELACNDDARGTLQSQVAREMANGETVLIRVSGYGASVGAFILRAEGGKGAITGTIGDSSGAPRTEAEAELYNASGYFYQQLDVEPDGSFLFAGLPPGDYFVLATDPGLVDEVWDNVPCLFCEPELVGMPVTVSTDLVTGIDFRLDPGGSIAGVLTRESTGEPLGGNVYAYNPDGDFEAYTFTNYYFGYSLDGLPEGAHFVRASASNYEDELFDDLPCALGACDPTQGTPVTVLAGEKTGNIDFRLEQQGEIAGLVTSAATGAPIESVFVTASAALSGEGALTRSDGTYVIEGLTAGNYTVHTSSSLGYLDQAFDSIPCEPTCDPNMGDLVPVEPETTTNGVDFSLTALGVVEGTVVAEDSGLPIDRCTVRLYDTSAQEVGGADCDYGSFRVVALPDGIYFAATVLGYGSKDIYEDELFDDIGCDPSCDVSQGTPIPVFLNTTTIGVDFALRSCPWRTRWDLADLVVLSTESWQACETITAGPGFVIGTGGQVTLRTGREVVLRDGFAVDGGALEILVEPSAATD